MSDKKFKLNAETILYMVKEKGGKHLYGMPNVLMEKMSSGDSLIKDRVWDDLQNSKCARMDFNGKVTIDRVFEEWLLHSMDVGSIVQMDIVAPDGSVRQIVVYYSDKDEKLSVLENEDGVIGEKYSLFLVGRNDLKDMIVDRISEYNINNISDMDVMVDSGILLRKRKDELDAEINDVEISNYIWGILNSNKTVLSARYIRQNLEKASFTAVLDEKGCIQMNMRYSIDADTYESYERVHFKSISTEEMMESVIAVMGAGNNG